MIDILGAKKPLIYNEWEFKTGGYTIICYNGELDAKDYVSAFEGMGISSKNSRFFARMIKDNGGTAIYFSNDLSHTESVYKYLNSKRIQTEFIFH
jgi:hypothetical protein